MLILLNIIGVFSSLIATSLIRKYAIKNKIIDLPNHRSSHTIPTPRGGGLAIVMVFLATIFLLWVFSYISRELFFIFFIPSFIVAFIGFLDDRGDVPAKHRLLLHFCAAIIFVTFISGFNTIYFIHYEVNLMWIGSILAVLYLVWMINLYNFMDGIDGIASVEGVTVLIGAAILSWYIDSDLFAIITLLFSAICGFLFWNFPPAKIFMGDAGSGFLGFILGAIALYIGSIDSNMFWSFLILLGVFIVDATFTLIKRVLLRKNPFEAHRSHAYQYASRKYQSHKVVTCTVGLINLFWLLPLALLVGFEKIYGVYGVLIAYLPLLYLAHRYNAGVVEKDKGV